MGKLVVVVANLEPRSMRGEASQGLVLKAKAAASEGGLSERIVVVAPLGDMPAGSAVA